MQSVVSVYKVVPKVERLLFKPILPTSVFYEMEVSKKESRISSFKDPSIQTSVPVIDIVDSGSINGDRSTI